MKKVIIAIVAIAAAYFGYDYYQESQKSPLEKAAESISKAAESAVESTKDAAGSIVKAAEDVTE